MNPTVISEEALTSYEVKKHLKQIKKRDEELSFRGQKVEEYLKQFTPLTDKASTELKEKLVGLEVPRLKEEHIAKLIDIMPLTEEDIKVVLSSFTVTIKKDDLKRINDTLAEYRK